MSALAAAASALGPTIGCGAADDRLVRRDQLHPSNVHNNLGDFAHSALQRLSHAERLACRWRLVSVIRGRNESFVLVVRPLPYGRGSVWRRNRLVSLANVQSRDRTGE